MTDRNSQHQHNNRQKQPHYQPLTREPRRIKSYFKAKVKMENSNANAIRENFKIQAVAIYEIIYY